MSKKLTPFFGDLTRPVHVGEYDTKWLKKNKPIRRYWDGEYWKPNCLAQPSTLQCFYWRGLAEKP